MPLFLQILLACLLGGLLSMLAALLLISGFLSKRSLPYAVSFSTGVLLATSMLHLMPEALVSGLTPQEAFPILLGGILVFFALEKFAIWRHAHHSTDSEEKPAHVHHHSHHHVHHHGSGAVGILIGDGFHNFTDGLLIAAAFMSDPALGWATTIAVITHEIPQEAGDFAILMAAGWKRSRALFWNGMSSLASVAGGIVGYFALDHMQNAVPYIVIVAAASFMYIAIADLLPRLKLEWHGIGWHIILLSAGIVVSIL